MSADHRLVAIDTLATFIEQLDAAGELVRISHPVSLNLELCEIADRVMKQPGGGKALLFEQPVLMNGNASAIPGGDQPVRLDATNGDVARRRDRSTTSATRITELLEMKVPEGLARQALAAAAAARDRKVSAAHASAGRRRARKSFGAATTSNLDKLPLIKCWPDDGGAYITLPMVITRDPERGIRNVGMYRIMQTGKDDAGDALAATQGRRGALARDGRARRADAGVHRARRGPAVDVFGERAAAADD